MKKSLIYFLLLLIIPMGLSAQVTVTGTTGADATYPRLGLAFAAINGNAQTGNKILISITSSTTETASAVLNAGAWTSLRIIPTVPGIIISGNLAAPIIDLNGADSVTIDGRVNGVKDLIIDNTSTAATAGTSTIRLRNDAAFNVIKYCILKGSETRTTSGIVYFNITTGSDGNLIDNNDITSSSDANRPVNAFYSLGIAAKAPSLNTISNNNIFNHLNRSIASNGIFLSTNNSNWIIRGNSFYETASFVPVASVIYTAIRISNTGENFNISDNFIGGSAPLCEGSPLTKTIAFNNVFYGVYANTGLGTVNTIQANTIRNIDWNNSGNGAWNGIYLLQGVFNCQNNNIGSITLGNPDLNGCSFYGIYKTNSAGNTTISNNTIGSLNEPNSILASSPSTGYAQTVRGIYNSGTGTIIISDNIIANLNNATTNTTVGNVATAIGRINGIYSASATGTHTISGNIVRDLTISNANNQPNLNASVCGIALSNPCAKNVTGNTIYNLSNTYASFTGHINGLLYMGSTNNNTIDRNFIHSLTVPSSAGASISGIRINTGASTYSNNIISLGGNTATTIYGIYETGLAGNNNKLYHNTVYIGGSPATGTNKSYALYSAVITNARDFTNNIFANTRSTAGGTNLHYAAYIVSTGGTITCKNNDYWVSGTGGILGYYGANKTALPIVTGQDSGSLSADPLFALAGGIAAENYIPTASTILAGLGTGITIDFAGATRSTIYPSMGAYEILLSPKITVYKASVLQATYFHLKDAFDAFNNGTHKTGAFEIRINGDVSEISSAVLNASGGAAEYTSVIIYPTIPGVKITGSLAAPLIDLNGADNVTIDGRVNATGLIRDLTNMTITNSSNSAVAGTSTIRMINSATNNTVKYCWLKGSETSSNSGVISFSTSTGTTGNNNNVIDNNYITNAGNTNRPVNAIYSLGTASFLNTGNTISNNDIFDFLNPRISTHGICVSTNSTGWTISGNSFYETTSFVPAGNVTYYIIRINNAGGNYSIAGNYIGGGTPLCGNPAWIKSNAFNNIFFGIHLFAGSGTSNSLQGNTIRNFDWSNSLNGNWTGIHIARGNADVGTVTGNTIGAAAGTGSILVTSKTTGNYVYGINITTPGKVNCLNNNIGSISMANADANGSNFYGINKSAAGATTISNNTIGSSSTASSITATSASTGNAQTVNGIYNAGTGLITISGNTIANLTNSTTNAAGSVTGLYFTGNTGANKVSENFIHTLALSASADSIYGIKTKAGSCTYYNNIITLGSTSENIIFGIYETGVAGNNNKIWFNTVYIGGSPASGTSNSYAFYSAATNTRDIRNNIFVNGRSTSGGTNFAAYFASSGATPVCNYNDYWAPGTGGTLGYFGGNKTALPIVTGQDGASQSIDPSFASTGVIPLEYIPAAYLQGLTGTGITTDFGGNARTIPTMGAWEGFINKWKGTTSTDWNTGSNWISGIVPGQDASIIFDAAPSNNCLMDQDRSVLNITDSTTYSIVANGHKLTIKGNLFFSTGPKIDASATGSTVEIASDSVRTIEKVHFSADRVYNLILNNESGVSLNSNFTVDNSLTINSGNLTINAPWLLTVSGTLTNNSGDAGLVIKSDATGDGKLLSNSSPNGTVELFLTGGLISPTVGRFHYFIPPVQFMNIGSTTDEVKTNLNVTNFGRNLLDYSEPEAILNSSDAWRYFNNYPDMGTPNFTNLTSDRGYNIYFWANDTIVFKGQLNGSSHSFNLSYTATNPDPGWNLVGNPFTCNYDLNGVAGLGTIVPGISNTVYYNNNGNRTYWNVYTNTGSTTGYSDILPPMTGFFVLVSQTGMSLSLPASSKTAALSDPRSIHKKSLNNSEKSADVRKIKLVLSSGPNTDETVVLLFDDATSAYNEHYDAFKLSNNNSSGPSISSQLNGTKYFMKAIAVSDTQKVVVPLKIILTESGTHEIFITEFENLEGIKVTLKHGDSETLLKPGVSYNFSSGPGTYDNFELVFGDKNNIKQADDASSQNFRIWYRNNYLNVNFSGDIISESESMIIYDMNGNMVYNNRTISLIPEQTNQVPISLQSGFYIADIVIDNKHHRLKFVVY